MPKRCLILFVRFPCGIREKVWHSVWHFGGDMFNFQKVKNLKPKDKPYKYTGRSEEDKTGGGNDGNGRLYLYVTPQGSKLWRMNYRSPIDSKQKTMSFGAFPEVSIDDAQQARDRARRMLKTGLDPMEEKKKEKSETRRKAVTFRELAESWYGRKARGWRPRTAALYRSWLEGTIYPVIGEVAVSLLEDDPPRILAIGRGCEEKDSQRAHGSIRLVAQVFDDAIADGLCRHNPADRLTKMLTKKQAGHYAAIIDSPEKLGKMLVSFELYPGTESVRYALQLLPYLAVRPRELREARWNEFDLDAGMWTIPPARMKQGREHLVPLASQIVATLRELRALELSGEYLFPSIKRDRNGKERPLGETAFSYAMNSLGYGGEQTAHGFRATARTMLHERLNCSPDAIEAQLSHRVPDRLGPAYNRSQHLEKRIHMMQAWADYLDELKAQAREE